MFVPLLSESPRFFPLLLLAMVPALVLGCNEQVTVKQCTDALCTLGCTTQTLNSQKCCSSCPQGGWEAIVNSLTSTDFYIWNLAGICGTFTTAAAHATVTPGQCAAMTAGGNTNYYQLAWTSYSPCAGSLTTPSFFAILIAAALSTLVFL